MASANGNSFFRAPDPVLYRPDHYQVCIPQGGVAKAREFYVGLLKMREVFRPPGASTSDGIWLYCGPEDQTENEPHANIHIGCEDVPDEARRRTRAHVCYSVRNIAGWCEILKKAGYPINRPNPALPNMVDRCDTVDPFGNRVELIEYKQDPLAPVPKKAAYFWHSKRAYEKTPLFTVAVWQGASVNGEVGENLKIVRTQLEAAKKKGADLVLFSELFLTGYALDRDTIHRLAVEQSSKTIQDVRDMCKELQIGICLGYPELEIKKVHTHDHGQQTTLDACCNPTEERSVFNAAILIDDRGEILSSYRKTHLWELCEKSYFTPGYNDELKVVEYKGVKMGINICYDIEFAEASRVLALEGCLLLLVPTALAKGQVHSTVPMKVVPTRALDNHVWVAYSNHIGPSYKDKNFCGLSGIIGPDGCDLERAGENDARLLIAELRPADFATNFESTPLLIDRRAELFHPIAHPREWL